MTIVITCECSECGAISSQDLSDQTLRTFKKDLKINETCLNCRKQRVELIIKKIEFIKPTGSGKNAISELEIW